MKTNICLIAHNRFAMTKQALESLFAHTDREQFTLTVLDDGSDGDSRYRLTWFIDYLRCASKDLLLVRNDKPSGVGGARNRCIAESEKRFGRGDFLYLSDNDVYFTDRWNETLACVYIASNRKLPVAILGGYSHPFNGTNKVICREHFLREEESGNVFEVHAKNAVDGLSWLLAWDTWDRFGPFDANTTDRRSSEDVAFCLKVRDAGYEVAAIYPHVVLNCGKTDSWGGTIPGADVAVKEVEGVLVQ